MAGILARLLVVDDDPDIVKLVTVAMRSRGYEVDGATSLEDAMTAVAATTYDVVLTDKNLKGSTGLELIDALVLRAPSTAIVLMTRKVRSADLPRSTATWASPSARWKR